MTAPWPGPASLTRHCGNTAMGSLQGRRTRRVLDAPRALDRFELRVVLGRGRALPRAAIRHPAYNQRRHVGRHRVGDVGSAVAPTCGDDVCRSSAGRSPGSDLGGRGRRDAPEWNGTPSCARHGRLAHALVGPASVGRCRGDLHADGAGDRGRVPVAIAKVGAVALPIFSGYAMRWRSGWRRARQGAGDGGWLRFRRGKVIPLIEVAEQALALAPLIGADHLRGAAPSTPEFAAQNERRIVWPPRRA